MAVGKKSRSAVENEDDPHPERVRNHKFESFTQRVARLKIDPIRRNKNQQLEGDETQSHFRNGLNHWRELNLADSFSKFVQEVEPLSDSLPQVLHYKAKIVDILVQYLAERNILSLEPLLSLTSSLAHDLGVRFEEHFPTVLALILDIAAKHKDIEAVEWSFSCLAWLFKYLSRLLVPDLRPTYNLVAKALGKENHKPFIARFAAEAMSFLVRKAASVYSKDTEPLVKIIKHIYDDLKSPDLDRKHNDVYQYGVMSLFANTMKGVESGLHTTTGVVFKCLLEHITEGPSEAILVGVTTSLIHHSDSDTISPLTEVLYQQIEELPPHTLQAKVGTCAKLLFALVSVRHGTRVKDWREIFSNVSRLLASQDLSTDVTVPETNLYITRTVAVAFSTAPIDACMGHIRLITTVFERLSHQNFIAFCMYLAELNQDRFQKFALSIFLKNFMALSEAAANMLLLTVSSIAESFNKLDGARNLPMAYQNHIVEVLKQGSSTRQDVRAKANYLELASKIQLDETVQIRIREWLLHAIRESCARQGHDQEEAIRLYLGIGLSLAIRHSVDDLQWKDVSRGLYTMADVPVYLDNVRLYISSKADFPSSSIIEVADAVKKNLASPSKALRQSSLLLLQAMVRREIDHDAPILATALQLEEITLDAKSTRSAAMQVRRLLEQYKSIEAGSWLAKVIPIYCFGLFHFKLSQVWSEAIEVLSQMSALPQAEATITDMIFAWLDVATSDSCGSRPSNADNKVKYDEFQCTSRSRIVYTLDNIQGDLNHADQCLALRAQEMQKSELQTNDECRQHALRILKGIPELAEKRSRRLVPIFLRSSVSIPDIVPVEEDESFGEQERDSAIKDQDQQKSLSRRDQLSLLDIFGLFTNPRMLYQTSEVFNELLRYLSSGDAKIQKASLKALSTWKLPALEKYSDNFSNLLDDTRFREEIATLLDQDEILRDLEFNAVLPFLLRLLYGRVISRVGSTSSKGSLGTKRRAVFDALARLDASAVQIFVSLALGPLSSLSYINDKPVMPQELVDRIPKQRQQLGLLNLLRDMINSLGDKIAPALESIVPALIFCGQEDLSVEDENKSVTAKDIRKAALQCLTSISTRVPTSALSIFIPGVVAAFITPRVNHLAIETSQSVAALLQLLAAWASLPEMTLWLTKYDDTVLDAVTRIFTTPAVKDDVLHFVIDSILKPMARFAADENLMIAVEVKQSVLAPNMNHILERLGLLIESNPDKRILADCLSLLSNLAASVEDSTNMRMLLRLSASLLNQPGQRVSPRSKGDILGYLVRFIPLSGITAEDELLRSLEASLMPLLLYFKDRGNRVQLGKVLLEVARLDPTLSISASICQRLDSFSPSSIDEPDFELRLQAFRDIETSGRTFSSQQWQPIIYSLLYHVQDTEELAIRTSASAALKAFVTIASDSVAESPATFALLDSIVLPALRSGVTQKSELVRLEYLSVFGQVVKQCPSWDRVNDLHPLLVNDDEEASFFSNILHIQQHRRLKALRRLASEASKGQFRSVNIAHFMIPLLEHFVLDQPEDKSEHNVVFETITTLSALALGLEWPQFRAMFRRYTTYVMTKPDLEKASIRLLTMMTDALNTVVHKSESQSDHMEVDGVDVQTVNITHRLGQTLPKGEKLSVDVAKNLTAPLREYVHQKDETLVSQRVPVAVTVAKLIMLLDQSEIVQQLPPLLTDVSQILRSRVQESRDLARKTLIDISRTVGPEYFGFILKELRTALPRGYQLHVLSFTVHMLLVQNESLISDGQLDYCLIHIANIIMDDMFGAIGQEKDAEDYVSQMREVKTNKSYDSMEIMARSSSLSHVNSLVQPIMALLEERLDLRMLKKIDELLRRLGVGLLRNQAINSQEALVLCFELLQRVYHKEQAVAISKYQDHKKKRFLINMNSVKKSNVSHGTISAVHKLARFAFDLLRMILSRHDELQTPKNIIGFMPLIGEAIMSNHEEVQISVIRLIATIIRVPLAELDKNAPVYLSEAMALIKNATSTSSEAAQAALKLFTVLLRDRDNVSVRDSDVAFILTRIKTDLDEPDRQGITFNFLKAILHRKVVIPEVYEVMDIVGAMMVRSQAVSARNTARGSYVQFLVNYPQGKDRLKKQWAFLVKNLEYQFPDGRQSVLEAIHQLLGKVGDQVSQEIINTFFAPLVLATVNDESGDCRRMSALLLKEFFERADNSTMAKMLEMLRVWISQDEQVLLLRVSLQTYILYVEAIKQQAENELPLLISRIHQLLDQQDTDRVVDEWETIYFSLQLLSTLVQTFPSRLFDSKTSQLWNLAIQSTHYPHAWVKLSAAKLLGLFFADFARTNATNHTLSLPVTGSGGLTLDLDTMKSVTRSSFNALKLPGISEELATQLVKNVVFLGRLFGSSADALESNDENGVMLSKSDADEQVEEDSDQEEADQAKSSDPLGYIFWRTSFILRRETITARAAAMIPKTASMRLLIALCSHLSVEQLTRHLLVILSPLQVLTDPATTVPFSTDEGFKTAHAELISNAQELMSTLQTKIGTAMFVDGLSKIRESVKQKRDERRVKRRIEAVSAPEKTGFKRTKKRTQQREKRKDKNSEYRAQRRGW